MNELAIYLNLARASERRQRLLVRDKLLVLAAVAAARLGLEDVAQFCRQTILMHNPGHLLRRWTSLAKALGDLDFQVYLRRLMQLYPLERAEHMLGAVGFVTAGERELYYSDHEYAAAILGTTPDALAMRVDRQESQVPRRASESAVSGAYRVLAIRRPNRWRRGLAALARLFR